MLEIVKWLALAVSGVLSVMAAYSKLRRKDDEPTFARVALVGAALSFALTILTQSFEQMRSAEQAQVAAQRAEQAANAANEMLRQIRRTQTTFTSMRLGPVFGYPTTRGPLRDYVAALFDELEKSNVKDIDTTLDLTPYATDAAGNALTVGVRPGSRYDPANLGHPVVATYLRNLGLRIDIYAADGQVGFTAWSIVTLPAEHWLFGREHGGGQTQWLETDPSYWHRSSKVDSIEDLLGAKVVVTIAAADNDHLDITTPLGSAVADLLDHTTFSALMLLINQRVIHLESFLVETRQTDEGEQRVYQLPRTEEELFRSPFA